MDTTPTVSAEEQELRALAQTVDCFTESQIRQLSGWAEQTIAAKRKRGEAPPYVRHGRNFFYPRVKYMEWLNRVREPRNVAAAEAL